MQRERLGQAVNLSTLQEIAAITRGQLVKPNEMAAVVAAIQNLPEPEAETRRIRLWAHPVWVGLLLTLMSLFWIGRKLAGVI
jgi:hypothetical protein